MANNEFSFDFGGGDAAGSFGDFKFDDASFTFDPAPAATGSTGATPAANAAPASESKAPEPALDFGLGGGLDFGSMGDWGSMTEGALPVSPPPAQAKPASAAAAAAAAGSASATPANPQQRKPSKLRAGAGVFSSALKGLDAQPNSVQQRASAKALPDDDLDKEVTKLAHRLEESPVIEAEGPVKNNMGLAQNENESQVIIKGAVELSEEYRTVGGKSWQDLGLNKALLMAVAKKGFTSPSKIQAQALPMLLSSRRPNMRGQAQHGSGKTATYVLAMLMLCKEEMQCPQAVCICPARELTLQVGEVVKDLGQFTKLKVYISVPGSQERQITEQIVVGTPGSIEFKIKRKYLNTSKIGICVVDEADHMIKVTPGARRGLGDQTLNIIKNMKGGPQILLFSATFEKQIIKYADKILGRDHIALTLVREDLSLKNVKQFKIGCRGDQHKLEVIDAIYEVCANLKQTIVFCQRTNTAQALAQYMRKQKHSVSLLHGGDPRKGGMTPEQRDSVMVEFREGRSQVLITTNVLARGVDVPAVGLVINFDIPTGANNQPDFDAYVHRIGRAGRFGRKGATINFLHDDASRRNLDAILRHWKHNCTELQNRNDDDIEAIAEVVDKALGLYNKSAKEGSK